MRVRGRKGEEEGEDLECILAHVLVEKKYGETAICSLPSSSPCSQAASDQAKKVKSLQAQLKEINGLYEDEQHQRDEQHELALKAEKKANEFQLELEELRTSVEQVHCMGGDRESEGRE